ncbi:MAG: hypothetical protein ABEJ79_00505 [Halolamina sp.]
MSGFDPKDKYPMLAAVVVVVLGNVVGYFMEVTIYLSILATPLALVAFGVVRYLLYGRALPEALSIG